MKRTRKLYKQNGKNFGHRLKVMATSFQTSISLGSGSVDMYFGGFLHWRIKTLVGA